MIFRDDKRPLYVKKYIPVISYIFQRSSYSNLKSVVKGYSESALQTYDCNRN